MEFPFYHSCIQAEAGLLHQQFVQLSLPIQYITLRDRHTYQDTKISSCSKLRLSSHLQSGPLSMPRLTCYLKRLYILLLKIQLFLLILFQIQNRLFLFKCFGLRLATCLISNNLPFQYLHSF